MATTWLNVPFGVDAGSTTGCSKRPSSKAAASEEARRTLRYVESLSDARRPLADFFGILLKACAIMRGVRIIPQQALYRRYRNPRRSFKGTVQPGSMDRQAAQPPNKDGLLGESY